MVPQRTQKAVAACLLVGVLLLTGGGVLLSPNVAYAQDNIVGDFSGCLISALVDLLISAVLSYFFSTVPTADIPGVVKEAIKDCLAWAAANAALEILTEEIVGEINSGFAGNPAYVTSLASSLLRAADGAFVGFIQSGDLSDVSPSFRQDVAFAVIDDYNKRNDFGSRMASTLDEDLYDIDAFFAGDFSQGGWNTWFKATQEPQNNPYGAYLLAQEEADRRVAAGVSEKQTEIEVGRGFQNKEVCEDVETGTKKEYIYSPVDGSIISVVDVPVTETRCRTVTPGSVIQESLQKVLGSGVDRIVQADELNEALSLLLTGLITDMLSSDEGLFGSGEFISTSAGFANTTFDPGSGIDSGGDALGPVCRQSDPSPGSRTVSISVASYTATQTGDRRIDLPLDGHYPEATLSFDFYLNNIDPTPAGAGEEWQTILSIRGVGSNSTSFFRILVAEDGDSILSLRGNTTGTNWYRQGTDFREGQWYTIKATYDAGNELVVTIAPRGGAVFRTIRGVPANSIFDVGSGTTLILNDGASEGKGLAGSIFENLRLTLTPGDAVCSNIPRVDAGGDTSL